MKIWIGYVSCGFGHKKAAEAVYQAFDKQPKPYLFNLLDFMPLFLKLIYERGYALVVKYFPALWAHLYRSSHNGFLLAGGRFFNFLAAGRFVRYLKRENPDVIISTHFIVSEISGFLKHKGLIKSRIITVITDYTVDPVWVSKGVDFYVTACEEVKDMLCGRFGVEESKVFSWGIPLRGDFYRRDFSDVKKKYGIPEGVFTLLLFSSRFGIGPFKTIVDKFRGKFAILAVYGKNPDVGRYLKNIRGAVFLKSFKFKEDVHELMRSADLVVTKAGGLSVSECIALNKPMVFMKVIPGQEDANADFVVRNGLGFRPKNLKDLLEVVDKTAGNPDVLKQARGNFANISFENSAVRIKELALLRGKIMGL